MNKLNHIAFIMDAMVGGEKKKKKEEILAIYKELNLLKRLLKDQLNLKFL